MLWHHTRWAQRMMSLCVIRSFVYSVLYGPCTRKLVDIVGVHVEPFIIWIQIQGSKRLGKEACRLTLTAASKINSDHRIPSGVPSWKASHDASPPANAHNSKQLPTVRESKARRIKLNTAISQMICQNCIVSHDMIDPHSQRITNKIPLRATTSDKSIDTTIIRSKWSNYKNTSYHPWFSVDVNKGDFLARCFLLLYAPHMDVVY